MMRIIVASDSHGHNEILDTIYDQHPEASLFLHCGDLCDDPRNYPNWLFVLGNNDFWGEFPNRRILSVGTHRLFMEHSHRCSFFHREDDLVRLAKGHACDIVCFGHTHRSYIEKRKCVFLLNPGSTWMSRDGNPPSYAILDVDTSISAQIVFLDQ